MLKIECLSLLFVSVLIKFLLIPSYHSTDFDVHQNWLRISSQVALKDWRYVKNQSVWTLDYPPLFAYFEWVLALVAQAICPSIVTTINSSLQTIYFQRISVIVSQIPYLWILSTIYGRICPELLFIYFVPNFILLDNIHFQYNILMQAILLWSVHCMHSHQYLTSAFIYAMLLNFKHIYIYCSFAYFIWLLMEYVLSGINNQQRTIKFIKLGAITVIPFLISFLPFVTLGGYSQLAQIFKRLFPFQRGLVHDYWAPNFWALYYFVDKILSAAFKILIPVKFEQLCVKTAAANQLRCLPSATPFITIVMILIYCIPLICKIFQKIKSPLFYQLLTVFGVSFFTFGFHVHEKAIIPYLCALYVFQTDNKCGHDNQKSYTLTAIYVNFISLIPLLINVKETALVIVMVILLIIYMTKYSQSQVNLFQQLVIWSGFCLLILYQLIFPFIISASLEFLPLMLISVWAATLNLLWFHSIYYELIVK